MVDNDLKSAIKRYEQQGIKSLFDHEILAILLNMPVKRAEELLQNIGGIQGLTFLNIQGLSKQKTRILRIVMELKRRLSLLSEKNAPTIGCPEDVFNILSDEMKDLDREHFKVFHLTTKHTVKEIETISIGSLNSCIVHPREVFKNAIKNSSAGLILVHNHPSGDPDPSHEDIEMTRRLTEAGNLLGIKIIDHVIVGYGKYVSMKERGII